MIIQLYVDAQRLVGSEYKIRDSIIGNLEKQKEIFVSIVSEKDKQNEINEETIQYNETQLRKENRKKTFLIIGISALISSAIYQNVIK